MFTNMEQWAEIRRRVLTTSIFGVDLNPMAVWLCELRLWLSIVIESDEVDPMRVTPLPNLDRHIRVGDSLAGGAFDDRGSARTGRKLAALRSRYMRAVGPRKQTLARDLDKVERSAALDALARVPSRGEASGRGVPRWRQTIQEGNEAVRSALGTVQDVTQV